jgi:hypothetical protein
MNRRGLGRRLIFAATVVAVAAACSAGVPSASPSPPSPASTLVLPPGFPIGSWSATITAEDLLAVDRADLATIGMSEGDLVKENSGTFTTTFAADGTWTTVQATDQAVKWPVFRGTFAPVGTDGITQTTAFPPEFEGDEVVLTWRVADGLLYLSLVEPPDPILRVTTEAHPWSPAT